MKYYLRCHYGVEVTAKSAHLRLVNSAFLRLLRLVLAASLTYFICSEADEKIKKARVPTGFFVS